MTRRIRIAFPDVAVTAALADTCTADLVWQALPMRSSVSTWGDEIYFSITVSAEESPDADDVQDVGAVAFWPAGSALCLFFGPTPASTGGEPRAIGPVNPVGMIEGDPAVLRSIRQGAPVEVDRA